MTKDSCAVCGGRIDWAAGGEFWLHERGGDGHAAVPVSRTDLVAFAGCRLHRESRPDACDACGQRGLWAT